MLHIEETFKAFFPNLEFENLFDEVSAYLVSIGGLKEDGSKWDGEDDYYLELNIWNRMSQFPIFLIPT